MSFRDSAVQLVLSIRDLFSPAAKKVEDSARSLRDVAEDLADQIKKTDQAIAQAVALDELRARADRVGANLAEATNRVSELRGALRSNAGTNEFAAQLAAADAELTQLAAGLKATAAESRRLETELARALKRDAKAQELAADINILRGQFERASAQAASLKAQLEKSADPAIAAQYKKVSGQADALGVALRQATKAADTLGANATNTDALRKQLEASKERGRELARAIGEAETAYSELQSAANASGASARAGIAAQLKEAEASAKAFAKEAKTVAREVAALEKALAAAGVDSGKLATEQRRLAAESAQAAEKLAGIKKAVPALKDVGDAAQRTRASVVQINDGITRLTGQILGLAGAYGALNTVQSVTNRVDQFLEYESRLKNATRSESEYLAVREAVLGINQRTGASMDSLTALYQRSAESMRVLGRSHEESMALIEGVAKVTRNSGASAQSASAALIQFAQGLGAGRLAGDEFKSIAENMPPLLDHIAAGLKISRGELRKWSEEGRLTGEVVLNALQGQLQAIDAQFANAPKTVGVAAQKLSDAWSNYLRTSEDVAATQEQIASAFDLVRENLDAFVKIALFAGEVVAAALGARLLFGLVSIRNELKLIRAESGMTWAQMVVGANASTAATAASTRALAIMGTTLRALSGLGFGLLLAAAYELGSYLADKLDPAFQNLRRSQADLELQNAKGSRQLAEFNRELGTNYKSLDDVNRAIDDGLILWNEQIGKWETADQVAKRNRDTFAETAKTYEAFAGKLEQLVGEFDGLVQAGRGVDESIEAVAASALKAGEPARLLAMVLAGLSHEGKATAEQIGRALPGAFAKLESARAAEIVQEAQQALAKGTQNAEQYEQVIRGALSPAFAKLGLDIDTALGGVSQTGRETVAALQAIVKTGVAAGDQLRAAFTGAIGKAKTIEDLQAIERELVRVKEASARSLREGEAAAKAEAEALRGSSGSLQQYGEALNRYHALQQRRTAEEKRFAESQKEVQEKIAELTPGIQTAGEAFKVLGVTSDEALRKAAASAREAYEFVRQTGASLPEQERAWLVYAEKAIAANGGVASATLRAEAASKGMSAQLAELEEQNNTLSKAMEQVIAKYDAQAKAAEQETSAVQQQLAAREQAVQVALELAKAEGDVNAIRRAELEASKVAIEISQALAAAKQAEADVSWAKVRALQAEAQADFEVTQAEREAIATAREAANTKQDAADQALAHADAEKLRADALRKSATAMFSLTASAGQIGEQLGVGAEYAERFGQRLFELAQNSETASRNMAALRAEAARYAGELKDVDEVLAQVQDGQISLAELANYNIDRFGRLGEEDLRPLREAIEDARERMASLADEASDTVAQLSEELAQLEGRELDAERIRQERKVRELEAALAEAKAAGNKDAVRQYEEALRLLKEINAIRDSQARAKDSGESADLPRTQQRPSTSNLQRGDQFGATRLVRIEVTGFGAVDVAEESETDFISMLERLARVSARRN